jgi:hypothetical protein
MTAKQTERMVKAYESIALNLGVIGKMMAKRIEREFPADKEPLHAEIFKQGEDSAEETSKPGRFERLFTGG